MENVGPPLNSFPPSGTVLAPIHCFHDEDPLRVCLFLRSNPDQGSCPFVLVRELPGSRVYLGAVCDAQARLQEWVEVWVQMFDLRDVAFSGSQERLTNYGFDQRWRSEHLMSLQTIPELVIVTGMEQKNPGPILIKSPGGQEKSVFAQVQATPWKICKDDALLDSFGLAPYSTSPFRYLYDPAAHGAKTFLATASDAPVNAHVLSIERLKEAPGTVEVFNPQAGLVRVTRFSPLGIEEYFRILEGRPWEEAGIEPTRSLLDGIYGELQAWSASPKAMPFLLHGPAAAGDRLTELFFLKLSALLGMFKEVRAYVKTQQLPLLNLSPSSFNIRLPLAAHPFPAFWAAKCLLVKPGQAYPLKIKSTEQRYFIRLGRIEPSPFLPEGLGAHSFGIGSVRLRNVLTEAEGVVLEGTLVAEDYLGVDARDLLWFKLPIGEERLELYAHVYSSEAVGPKEARFRTVPAKLPEPVLATLKRTAAFAKSPYEIWPLLSSPCDLHSLGIIAIRALLANGQSNLPVIVDDVLGLARRLGKEPVEEGNFIPKFRALLEAEPKLIDLVRPPSLLDSGQSSSQAWDDPHNSLWLETVALVLRLFPGTGSHSYCQNFGDVSPLALETVFDRPVHDLETLLLRLRSILVPTLSDNAEIAAILLDELATA
jgi:hypothetical protein